MNAPTSAQDLLTFAGRMIDPRLKRTVVVVGDRDRLRSHALALADHFGLVAIQHDYGNHNALCPDTLRLTEHVVHIIPAADEGADRAGRLLDVYFLLHCVRGHLDYRSLRRETVRGFRLRYSLLASSAVIASRMSVEFSRFSARKAAILVSSRSASASTEVNVRQPGFFTGFGALARSVPPADWRTYLRWHAARAAAVVDVDRLAEQMPMCIDVDKSYTAAIVTK